MNSVGVGKLLGQSMEAISSQQDKTVVTRSTRSSSVSILPQYQLQIKGCTLAQHYRLGDGTREIQASDKSIMGGGGGQLACCGIRCGDYV